MTEVTFYFGVRSRLGFIRKFLSKHIIGARRRAVVLFGGSDESQEASRHFWAATERGEFIPSCFISDSEAEFTPVLLALAGEDPFPAQGADVLINCTDGVPEGFSTFGRVVEFAEADSAGAEKRAAFYRERGYAVRRHDLGGKY